ncbi:hypothetical protein AB6A40_001283 [Gnathostoma spinigerum]|uniref:Uncharacterized protein n=1 Tax=Gnathostoma spinigerum TaxID=75299 RepID=A0ABD6E8T9_9BILA
MKKCRQQRRTRRNGEGHLAVAITLRYSSSTECTGLHIFRVDINRAQMRCTSKAPGGRARRVGYEVTMPGLNGRYQSKVELSCSKLQVFQQIYHIPNDEMVFQ